jgi:hypothetical protein
MTIATNAANSVLISDNGDAIDRETWKTRDQFYPGWWTYLRQSFAYEDLKPFYCVIYRSAEERELAKQVKPDFVRAEFIERIRS